MIEVLKQRQNWALMNPARTLQDLCRDGYRFDYPIGGLTICTTLSVNLFEEPLAWHCAIAIRQGADVRELKAWTKNDRIAALAKAMEILDGLGTNAEPIIETGSRSIEIWRPLSIDEAVMVANIAAKDKPLPMPQERVGLYNVYDFSQKKTRVGETLYLPSETREFYADRTH